MSHFSTFSEITTLVILRDTEKIVDPHNNRTLVRKTREIIRPVVLYYVDRHCHQCLVTKMVY